jgi:signal transduction histidine kinase
MRLLRLFIVAAGLAVGVIAESVLFDRSDPARWLPDLLVGWSFIACGMIVMPRHPGSRSGVFMLATGFLWFLPNFAGLTERTVGAAAAYTLFWHRGPLVQLVLTYPDGRNPSSLTRAAVLVGYVAAVWYPIWQSELATLVLAVLLLVVTVRDQLRSAGPGRRAHRFSVVAATALCLVVGGEAIVRASGPPAGATDVMLVAYEAVLVAIAVGLTVGLVTRPWERTDVTDLVVELGRGRAATLRGELSRALGDPTLRVGFWIAEQERFVDADGSELDTRDEDQERSQTLVERDGEPIALIVHDPTVLTDPGLVRAVAAATKLGASNARLQADVRARQAELRASRRRIVGAADEERSRLERRLHDTVERQLDALKVTLSRAREAAGERTKASLDETEAQLERTQQDLHRFARGIHPHDLAERGLAGALTSLASGLPFPVDVSARADRLPSEVESCVYFVCLEALTNVAKYARASRVRVSIDRDGRGLTVFIEDNGVGGADPAAGSGLRGLADRVEALGGTLHVESPDGRGTRVTADIPVSSTSTGTVFIHPDAIGNPRGS